MTLFLGGTTLLIIFGVLFSFIAIPAQKNGTVANATEVENGSLGVWTKNANSLLVPAFNGKSVVVNGYILLFGGTGSTTVQVAKTKNGGATEAWIVSSSTLPTALSSMGVATANGYVYVVGGIVATTTQVATYYAPVSNDGSLGSWITGTPLPAPRSQMEAVVSNGYIYVVGGNSTNGISPQSSVFYAKLNEDGSIGAWQSANALPVARRFLGSVVANGYLYATGGFGPGNGSLASVNYAQINSDGSLGPWIQNINPLPAGRGAHQSIVLNNHLYLTSGINAKPILYAKLNPDGSTGPWSSNPYDPSPNLFSVAIGTHNNYVYLLGGTLYTGGTTLVFYAPTEKIKTVLMFGDSITKGAVGDPDSSYPGLIQAMRSDLQVVNAGVPGLNSYVASATLKNLLDARPYHTMTLLIGINDPARNGFPIDPIRYTETQETANNVLGLATLAHNKGVKDIYVMPVIPAFSLSPDPQKLVQYFSRDVALWQKKLMFNSTEYPYIHFVDVRDEFSIPGWQNFTTDGVHPTLSGRQLIADQLNKNIPVSE